MRSPYGSCSSTKGSKARKGNIYVYATDNTVLTPFPEKYVAIARVESQVRRNISLVV
jgi:hypothetical protein